MISLTSRRLVLFFALQVCGSLMTLSAASTSTSDDEDFARRLDVLTQSGDDTPDEALRAIGTLPPGNGAHSARVARLRLVASGIVNARNGRVADVRVVAEKLRQLGAGQPIALADSALIDASLDQNDDLTEQAYAEARTSAGVYEEHCARDETECDYRDWFRALNLLEVAAARHGNMGMATSAADRMLTVARNAGDRTRESRALAVAAVIAQINDQPALATKHIKEATALAQSTSDLAAIVEIHLMSAIVHFYRHDYEATRDDQLTGLELAERAHLWLAAAHLRANLGDTYFRLHQPERAVATMAPALATARDHGSIYIERLLLHNTTLAEIALNRPQYRDDLKHVLDMWARSRSARVRVEAFQELSTALVAAGDADAALELFKQEEQIVFAEGNDRDMLARLLTQQQASLRGHDAERRRWLMANAAALLFCIGVAFAAAHLRRRNRRLAIRNAALYREAHLDALTGLANRHGLDAIVDRDGSRGVEGLLYVVDLDHFKRVNDELGHATGDAVLVEVARRLRSTTRDTDVVVRWGGEEFLIFVRTLAREEARDLAQRLLSALSDSKIEFGPCELRMSASIGYAKFPLSADASPITLDQAFAIVDAVMYRSKSHGRNRATGIVEVTSDLAADPDRLSRTLGILVTEGTVSLETTLGPSASEGDNSSPASPQSASCGVN